MAQTTPPEMDYPEHERTYTGFIHFAEVGTVAVLAIVAALAVGGGKHAWGVALFGTILAVVTGAVGIAAPSIGWRAPLLALVIMLLSLVLL